MKKILTSFAILFSFAAMAQDYTLHGSEVVLSSKTISFEAGTAVLTPESEDALTIIKNYLDDKSYISLLRIEGHTDNSGNAADQQKLSEKRALAVCMKLVSMGVDCKRLIAVGFGSTKPVADNSTPAGKAENRRISFINVSLRGRVIGGLPIDGGGVVAGEVCK